MNSSLLLCLLIGLRLELINEKQASVTTDCEKYETDNRCLAGVFFITAVVATCVGLSGLLTYTSSSSSFSYFKTVTELKSDASLIGKTVRVGGQIVPGSIQKNGTTVTFKIDDTKNTMLVTYEGAVPSTFGEKVSVIAEGTYAEPGQLKADSLVTKCPSKYANEKIVTK